jgi:hypothetical protein
LLLWLPGKLPGLNELVNAKAAHSPKVPRGVLYNQLKKSVHERVQLCVGSQKFRTMGGHFNYLLVESDKRRDPSNVAGAAIKMIEDGLQKAGVLKNDGWDQVHGCTWYPHCEDGAAPGVCLLVQDCPVLSKNAMIVRLQNYLEKGCVNRD